MYVAVCACCSVCVLQCVLQFALQCVLQCALQRVLQYAEVYCSEQQRAVWANVYVQFVYSCDVSIYTYLYSVCTYIYIHICAHENVHLHTHAPRCKNIRSPAHTHTPHIHMNVCMRAHTNICPHTQIHNHTCICINTIAYTHMYIHTCIHILIYAYMTCRMYHNKGCCCTHTPRLLAEYFQILCFESLRFLHLKNYSEHRSVFTCVFTRACVRTYLI